YTTLFRSHSRTGPRLRTRGTGAAGRCRRPRARARQDGQERPSTKIGRPRDPAPPRARGDGPRDRGDLRQGVRGGPARKAAVRWGAHAAVARALTARRSAPGLWRLGRHFWPHLRGQWLLVLASLDRKSTRLNSSHVSISYAV